MATRKPMNYVLYMPETLRAESVACYGHPLVRTPNMDRLASEGARFEQCYVQYPICGPSRCSMMTGWYPHNTGCRTNEFFIHPHQPSLLRYMKEAGYQVEFHGKNDLYSQDYFPLAVTRSTGPGYTRTLGLPTHNVHRGEAIAPLGEPGYYSFLYKPHAGAAEHFEDVHTVSRAIEFLRGWRPDDPPFVLYLPLALPHPPYTVPEPYYSMYDPRDVPPLRPIGLPGVPDAHRLFRRYLELDKLPQDIFRKINAVYLGMITFTDVILGRLLQALDETGLADTTGVFLFSDHGDYGGDYGMVHKTFNTLEDVMLRVPFIARVPGMVRGHSVAEPIELFDLMATVLDLAGIEARHAHFARSLRPQLAGAAGDPERVVMADGGFGAAQLHCLEYNYMGGQLLRDPSSVYHRDVVMSRDLPDNFRSAIMLRTNTHKLVHRTHDRCELYDMRRDPRELDNLFDQPQHAELRARLERQLLDRLLETSDVTPYETDARSTPVIGV